MSSNESFAYEIMQDLDVDYVLVIFGGVIGYSGDDINKFLWMVRIAEGEHPKIIREADYFTESGEYSVGAQASTTMLDSLMYKMSYYRWATANISLPLTQRTTLIFSGSGSFVSVITSPLGSTALVGM